MINRLNSEKYFFIKKWISQELSGVPIRDHVEHPGTKHLLQTLFLAKILTRWYLFGLTPGRCDLNVSKILEFQPNFIVIVYLEPNAGNKMEKLPNYLSTFYQFEFHSFSKSCKCRMRGKLQRRNLNTNQLDKLSEIYTFLDANGDGSLERVWN